MDVANSGKVIGGVPDGGLMETRLPDLHPIAAFLVNFMRAPAFNKLHGPFQGSGVTGSQQQVQMVGHENKLVQQIGSCHPVVKQLGNHDLGDFLDLKHGDTLSRLCRDEVSASDGRAVMESSHDSESSAAKQRAGNFVIQGVGALAPTFSAWFTLGSVDPGLCGPWALWTLGSVDPGLCGPWALWTLGSVDPGLCGPWAL